jgi:rRNA maturation endonuclease Nob1
MKIALIEEIRNVLKNEWGKVFYSQSDIDYDPRFEYSMHTDYDVYAMRLWLLYKTKISGYDNVISTATEYLTSLEKCYMRGEIKEIDENLSHLVAKKIYEMCKNDKTHTVTESDVKKIRIELRKKYSCHCCDTLTQTDNAEERYFPRLNVVYVPPLNVYVLTNNRKYVYIPDIDTYILDQRVMYKILDFCPFCGRNLKRDRVKIKNGTKYILKYIEMWRNEGEGKIGPYKTKHKMTRYGINCYDSYDAISEILSKKYVEYNNSFGVDTSGSIYKGANFITLEKLFDLAIRHKFYKMFDYEEYNGEIPTDKIIDYFLNRFSQKLPFYKNDREILAGILRDIFWNMFHNPECFDELLEN